MRRRPTSAGAATCHIVPMRDGCGARRGHRWRDHRLQRGATIWPRRAGRMSLLVEKAELTAGLDLSGRRSGDRLQPLGDDDGVPPLQHRPVSSGSGVFERVGSLRLASSPDQLRELERTASRARGIGLDAGVIGAAEARRADAGDLARLALRRSLPGRATATSTRMRRRTRSPTRRGRSASASGPGSG